MKREFSVSITPKMIAGEIPRRYASRTAKCAMESARAESTCFRRITSSKKFRFSSWNLGVCTNASIALLSAGSSTSATSGACFRSSSPKVPRVAYTGRVTRTAYTITPSRMRTAPSERRT